MHERVYNFIEKYLADNQYGFQRGISTERPLLESKYKIIKAYETKLYSCSIILDFTNAFDTLNHQILIDKIHHYGIRGYCLKWFESYLTNGKQCVQMGKYL